MAVWTVDVWHSDTFPVGPGPHDWRRMIVEAPDATTAELIACQWAASIEGRTPVQSVVIDWP